MAPFSAKKPTLPKKQHMDHIVMRPTRASKPLPQYSLFENEPNSHIDTREFILLPKLAVSISLAGGKNIDNAMYIPAGTVIPATFTEAGEMLTLEQITTETKVLCWHNAVSHIMDVKEYSDKTLDSIVHLSSVHSSNVPDTPLDITSALILSTIKCSKEVAATITTSLFSCILENIDVGIAEKQAAVALLQLNDI